MNERLIGADTLSPVGETFWSRLHKLAYLNHMDWHEFRQYFGAHELRSFNSGTRRQSDQGKNFRLDAISRYTGWSEADIETMFSRYYTPSWVRYKLSLSHSIRICPICYLGGVHLVLHQLEDFQKCPIHLVPLRVSRRLGSFSEDAGGMEKFAFCAAQDEQFNGSLSRDITLLTLPEKTSREYKQWLDALDKNIMKSEKYILLSELDQNLDLRILNRLLPGPDWIHPAIEHDDKVFHSKVVIDKEFINARRDERSLLNIYPIWDSLEYSLSVDPLSSRYAILELHKLLHSIKKHMVSIQQAFVRRGHRSRVWQAPNKYLRTGIARDGSVWATAFALLEIYMAPLLDMNLTSRHLHTYFDPIRHDLAAMWFAGPGRLLRIDQSGTVHNAGFVGWLRHVWTRAYIHYAYFSLLGLVCEMAFMLPTHITDLGRKLTTFVRPPVWIIENLQTHYLLHTFTFTAEWPSFARLFDSGFRGLDENYYNDFNDLGPLIELLNVYAYRVDRWQSNWDRIKTDYPAMVARAKEW